MFRPQITGNRRKMTHILSTQTEDQKKNKGCQRAGSRGTAL